MLGVLAGATFLKDGVTQADSNASKVSSAAAAGIRKEWGFLCSRLLLWSSSCSLQRKAEPPHHHAVMKRSSLEGEMYPVQDTTQSVR